MIPFILLIVIPLISAVGDGGCALKKGEVKCSDIRFASKEIKKTQSHFMKGRTSFDVEVSAYRRIQAVTRPAACESFVLFPRLLSNNDKAKTLTLQRFGKPIDCPFNPRGACCSHMCKSLPIIGEAGLCQQLACIAAVLHLANVTHLDMHPKNMLFGFARPLMEGGPPRAQVALYDFDLAAIPSLNHKLRAQGGVLVSQWTGGYNGKFLVTHGVTDEELKLESNPNPKAIGDVLARLVRISSVGFLQCAGPPSVGSEAGGNKSTSPPSFPAMIDCPFESLLKRMLPPRVLDRGSLFSLRAQTRRGPIAREARCGCGRRGEAMLC